MKRLNADNGKIVLLDFSNDKKIPILCLAPNLRIKIRKKIVRGSKERIDIQINPLNKKASIKWESQQKHSYYTGDIRYVYERDLG